MNSRFSIILLIFLLIVNVNLSFSQKSIIVKHVVKESLEESGEAVAKSKIKNMGLSFTEKAVANQVTKKIAREKFLQAIREQGFKSVVEYANSNASKKLLKSKTSSFSRKSISANRLSYNVQKSKDYIKRTLIRISISSKDQFITAKEYLSIIKTKKVTLKLGDKKNSTKLGDNMRKCMSEKSRNKIANSEKQAHHIVGEKTPLAAAKLKEFEIDINDPMNGIFLPKDSESGLKGTVHLGNHSQDYYDYIENLFSNCSSKEDCYNVLDKVKMGLYNGEIDLYNKPKINKTFTNKITK